MSVAAYSGREYRVVAVPATRRDGVAIAALLERHSIQCELCDGVAQAARSVADDAGMLLLTEQIIASQGSHLIAEALDRQPSWSDMPVIFLSRIGDESRALSEFLGQLSNVTLLDRPTSMRTLLSAMEAALRLRAKQYQLRDQLESVQAAEKALRDSDRRKDEFLAMLAHELRNPLAPICTATETLSRLVGVDDRSVLTMVHILDRQTRQLTRLVDDLLDVSRITLGRIEIQHQPVDIAEVVRQALESVDPHFKEKQHSVKTSLAPGLFVEGDSARLVQCVSNVLINAAKYTESGGEIRITSESEGADVVLSVVDSGIGIPSELLPRVFDLFVQNERALDRAQGGLGIGLSVVRRLVEMQHGEGLRPRARAADWGRHSVSICQPSRPPLRRNRR